MHQKFNNWLTFIPYTLLSGLLINSSYLSNKYIDFYFKGGFLSADCGDDCDSVMTSKFAMIFGIPIPIYGLSFFIVLTISFLILHLSQKKKPLGFLPSPKLIFEMLLIMGCVAASVFLYILYFELQMICKFCLISHSLTFSLTAFYFIFLRSKLS